MDEETLKRVAKSAHLAFGDDDLKKMLAEINELLDSFKMLADAPEGEGSGIIPIGVEDILREDVPGIFVDPYELLKDMKTYENYVRGPRLL
jgi:aspartyl-tRNA(Asn)/glutamyl-tRNA(Gln) amidotransferase subunit C